MMFNYEIKTCFIKKDRGEGEEFGMRVQVSGTRRRRCLNEVAELLFKLRH